MPNANLLHVIKKWDNIDWYSKKRIDWLILKSKWGKNNIEVTCMATIITLIIITIFESHLIHKLLIASATLLYLYAICPLRRQNKAVANIELLPDGTILSIKGGNILGWPDRYAHVRNNHTNALDKDFRLSEEHRTAVAKIVQTKKPIIADAVSSNGIPLKFYVKPIKDNQGEIIKLRVLVYAFN